MEIVNSGKKNINIKKRNKLSNNFTVRIKKKNNNNNEFEIQNVHL